MPPDDLPGSVMAGSTDGIAPGALVVAGEEETRVLLRGLLRLHRFRVIGEAESCVRAQALLREQPPATLVIDTSLTDGDALELADSAKRLRPATRVVLVARGSRPVARPDLIEPDVVLLRPFRIQEFAQAVAAPPPPSGG